MSSYQIKFDQNAYLTDQKLQIGNSFICLKDGVLEFNELDFTDFLYFHICKDEIYLQLHLRSEEQTNFKHQIKYLTLGNEDTPFNEIVGVRFVNCTIDNFCVAHNSCLKTIQFISSTVNGEFSFQDKKDVEVLFDRVVFDKYAQFQRSEFKKLEIKTSTFKEVVNFEGCTFENITLEYATFFNYVNFSGVTIKSSLDLTKTFFKETPNFLSIKNGDEQDLRHHNLANRETARIIKHSFEKQNNIIEANKFYALEMEKMEEELSNKASSNLADWIVFKFHKISSNHSQDWLLALLWMFNLTLAYSMFKQEEVMGGH